MQVLGARNRFLGEQIPKMLEDRVEMLQSAAKIVDIKWEVFAGASKRQGITRKLTSTYRQSVSAVNPRAAH
ncbi:hypothetical protein N7501_011895 [Penicillium viridicatum]|nr:hypothetical protein N7501_011895 [Penicillium viridicatum]